MAYQAIYRRWRPKTFDDVIGQEHITRTIKNEIINGKTAHAYLFCGTRGTGKTSTAKILAKAVNCLNPIDGNPCLECEMCLGIQDESILDVVELDAASKTSVDDIRSIIEEAMFLPTTARKKVYIIDEVHMISASAFNALLKTLEEPPVHVMFILATTEFHKIPATILSRCQRFDFRRIKNSDIVDRIKTIMASDGTRADDAALNLIAELGDGSMRDALSVLDQCLSFKEENLTEEDVISIIGIADDNALCEICDAIFSSDSGRAIEILDKTLAMGKDLGVFFERLVKFLRDILVIKLTKSHEQMFAYSEEKMNILKSYADKFSTEKLVNSLRLLNDNYAKAKNSSFSRTVYELCLIKMCSPETDGSLDALFARIAELEEKLQNARFASASSEEIREDDAGKNLDSDLNEASFADSDVPWDDEEGSQGEPLPDELKQEPQSLEKTEPQSAQQKSQDYNKTAIDWQKVVGEVRAMGGAPIFPHLLKTVPKILENRLIVVFEDNAQMSHAIISKQRNIEILEAAIEKVLGKKYPARCQFKKEMGFYEEKNPLEELEKIGAAHDIFEVVD